MPPELEPFSIIPKPVLVKRQPGVFTLRVGLVITADAANQWNATYLQGLLAPAGFAIPIQAQAGEGMPSIALKISDHLESLGREGYRLVVGPTAIVLEAPDSAGVFYGLQTLRQLLPLEIEGPQRSSEGAWQVPNCEIVDQPRFSWRGFMLDEGRYFHGKDTVFQTLDLMALQKLNVFHWHLTEDQGWRIEIKRYPRLTEIGSKRAGTSRGFYGPPAGAPHGGFYTQAEIREIVAYAARRHILVVPEIEMPGHSLAALAAYPELSCTGGPFNVATHFGVYPDIYCAGKEAVFGFLQAVLDEIMAMFPSPFIHIGGDEAPKQRWSQCPECQKRLRQAGLKNVHALQAYFTNRIVSYLAAHGRQAVGWNDILQAGLAESAIVHYWVRNRQAVITAIQRQKRKVIVSPYLDTYLDHSYSLTPLSRAYGFEPVFTGLEASDAQHILGLEAPLWSEFVPNRRRLDYQTYPRLTAFAETGWTPGAAKNLDDFRRRLPVFLQRLDRLGVRYASLREVEPSKFRQFWGVLTILQPQTRTARGE
jgi:hexosaminidase